MNLWRSSLPSSRKLGDPTVILALVCLPIFIGALDLTVISAVLPQVMYDLEIPLQTGLDEASWLVTGYLLAYTVTMSFMGRVSDLYGRRRVYLLCLIIFTVGSAGVAVAESLRWLIVGRVVQAIGGGAMVPVSMALVGDLFPPGRRGAPLGLIGAVDTAGWVMGHLYGGIMVRWFDWRLLFWLNIPLALLALGLTWWAMRKLPQPRTAEKLDWPGAALIGLSLTALNVGLSGRGDLTIVDLEQSPGLPPYAVPLVVLAGVLFLAFLWVEGRSAHPLLELSLFPRRGVRAASLINLVVGFCVVVGLVSVPLFINSLVADSLAEGAWMSGWLLSAFTLPMAAAAVPGGLLANRLGSRTPAWLGLLMAAAGFLALGSWTLDTTYAQMVPHLVVAGVGLGLVISPVATTVIDAAGERERGVAAALVIILRLVGMTAGVSAMTTYGVRRFQTISTALLVTSGTAAGEGILQRILEVSAQATVQVVNEVFWMGAAASLLGVVAGFWLRGETKRPRRLRGERPGLANQED